MQKIQLSFDVVNTSESHNIGIEVSLDKKKFFDQLIPPGTHHVVHEFNDDDSEHYLYIIMKGKTYQDTFVDEEGNIVKDAIIDIKNLRIDDIDIDQLLCEQGLYIHDGNGTDAAPSIHKFYGHMGCNGRVQLKFSCPIYIWLLETM